MSSLALKINLVTKGFRLEHKASLVNVILRCVFYLVIYYVFYCVWSSTFKDMKKVFQFLAYISTTEIIILSTSQTSYILQNSISSQQFFRRLLWPLSEDDFILFLELGKSLYRSCYLVALSFLLEIFVFKTFNFYEAAIRFAVCFPAIYLNLQFLSLIGFLRMTMQEIQPASWVWQKLHFVLGGVLMPLSLYPSWLMGIAKYSPFAIISYYPAAIASGMASDELIYEASVIYIFGFIAYCICVKIALKIISKRAFY